MKGKGSGWKGESRRHSLARKGVKTAKGSYTDQRRKEYENRKNNEINRKKDYLKRFLPDWFVDGLEYYGSTYYDVDEEQFIKLSNKNRDQRLQESLGETVIFHTWVDHYGQLVQEGKLVSIDDGEVTLEIDGKYVVTMAWNIKYASRKEKKKEVKKRPKNIPPNKFGFELVHDDYKYETYKAEITFDGIPVDVVVEMRYGTKVKTWYVTYTVGYGRNYFTYLGDGESGIEGRKNARAKAFEIIKNASMQDFENLSDFYKENIKEHGGRER